MNEIKKTTKRTSRKKKSDNEMQNDIKELNSTKIDGEKKNEISLNKKKDNTKKSNSNKKILKEKKEKEIWWGIYLRCFRFAYYSSYSSYIFLFNYWCYFEC